MTRVAGIAALVLLTLAGVIVLWELRVAVLLFMFSLVTAAVARPFVQRLVAIRVPRSVALVSTYLIGLAALAALAVATVGLVAGDVRQLAQDFNQAYTYVAQNWTRSGWLHDFVTRPLPPAEDLITALLGQHGTELLTAVLGTAFGVLDSAVNLIVIVILSIYWTTDREHFERLWLSLMPVTYRTAGRNISRAIETEVGAYIRSEVVQCLTAGLLLALGFRLLGLPYATLAAVLAALAWLIPWVGVVFAIGSLLLVSAPSLILNDSWESLRVAMAGVVILGVFLGLEFLMEPRLFNRRRYNSLLMVFAAIALADTFGILGLLLGPMLEVAIEVFVEQVVRLRMAAVEPSQRLGQLEQRLVELHTTVGPTEDLPPQLGNILDRLQGLVVQTREVLADPETRRAHPPLAEVGKQMPARSAT